MLHAFYYCELVRPFWSHVGGWTARISPKHLVLLDVDYVVDNIDSPYQGVSSDPSCGSKGGLGDAKQGIV